MPEPTGGLPAALEAAVEPMFVVRKRDVWRNGGPVLIHWCKADNPVMADVIAKALNAYAESGATRSPEGTPNLGATT